MVNRVVLIASLMAVFCSSSCALRTSQRDNMFWERVSSDHYRYTDNHLSLELKLLGQKFQWRIKNNSLIPLEIAEGRIFLRRAGDPLLYALWGAPHRDDVPQGPVLIPPDGYVSMSYPIQYNSTFYPFEVEADGAIWVEFTAQWKFQTAKYHLRFPADPKN